MEKLDRAYQIQGTWRRQKFAATIVFELVCHCRFQMLEQNVTLYVIILTMLLYLSDKAIKWHKCP